MKKLNSIQFYGMPLPIYAFFAIIVLACAYFNIIPNQISARSPSCSPSAS